MEIRALYSRVFDENGNVKPCGRRNCIELIRVLESETNINCGDKDTGYMNVENIKKAYAQVMSRE